MNTYEIIFRVTVQAEDIDQAELMAIDFEAEIDSYLHVKHVSFDPVYEEN